jgi:hypothetical protein
VRLALGIALDVPTYFVSDIIKDQRGSPSAAGVAGT